ncbi:cell wall-active antibiotics response protein [Actinomadura parmotrematis]|uniref:Cell wall-active antibiotics response protein n=1 Tax=Actinomadura parmotrematis TaxID=2864039 RepID=A0ABS7FXG6_9ACTN|nr:cell wall-active antibiotics response protein [Actinomadura parmotrematis]MBW8484148.1 cell wall-active antibiotics response protein [Actinomadura parmotrematis]
MTNSEQVPGTPAPVPSTKLHLALLGGFRREGAWRPARRTIAVTPVGGVDFDLTGAELPAGEFTLVKVSVAGGVDLTVPAGLNVTVQGFNLFGRRAEGVASGVEGAPTLHVHAYGIAGGVKIRRA